MVSRAQLLQEQIYQAPASGLGSLSLNEDLKNTFGDKSANEGEWHKQNDLNLGAQSGNMNLSGIYEADQDDREKESARLSTQSRAIRTSQASMIISDNFYGDNYNNFKGFSDVKVTQDTSFGREGSGSDIVIREDGMIVDANGMHITTEQHAQLEAIRNETTAGVTVEAQASREVLANLEDRDAGEQLTQEEILEFPPHVQESLQGNANPTVEDARNASLSKLPEYEAAVGGYYVSHDAPAQSANANTSIDIINPDNIPPEVYEKLTGTSTPVLEGVDSVLNTLSEDEIRVALEDYGPELDENGKYTNNSSTPDAPAADNLAAAPATAAPQQTLSL